jgi:hypothetical protein
MNYIKKLLLKKLAIFERGQLAKTGEILKNRYTG